MTRRSRSFAQVDVFSGIPFRGNPVAVVLDGDGLDTDDMQGFAAWTNLSETTFVSPPSSPGADYALRIFTPGGELPFAGHPTLGSAHAWLEAGGVPATSGLIVQECAIGAVSLRQDDGALAFRAPERLRTGPLDPDLVTRVAAGLRIDESAVLGHEWVDNGPGWVAVRLATAEAVLAIEPDAILLADLMVGVVAPHPNGSPEQFEVRAFAGDVGVVEDPVTGSLNAGIAQWLIGAGIAPQRYVASQGARLGRMGRVRISSDESGDVWVGGQSTTCITGTVLL